MQFCSLSVLCPPLLILKHGRVVFLLFRDHVIDDPCEFVGDRCHGLWGTHPGLQPTEVLAQKALAPVETLGSYP